MKIILSPKFVLEFDGSNAVDAERRMIAFEAEMTDVAKKHGFYVGDPRLDAELKAWDAASDEALAAFDA